MAVIYLRFYGLELGLHAIDAAIEQHRSLDECLPASQCNKLGVYLESRSEWVSIAVDSKWNSTAKTV